MSNQKEVPPPYETVQSHNSEPNTEKLSLKDKLNKLATLGKIERKKQEDELQNKINMSLDNVFPTVEKLEMAAKKGRDTYMVLHTKKYAKYNTYHFLNNTKNMKQIVISTENDQSIIYSISNSPHVVEIDHIKIAP